jgi:hypothetical protein
METPSIKQRDPKRCLQNAIGKIMPQLERHQPMPDLLFQMPLGVQLADVLDGQLLRGHFLLLFQGLQTINFIEISVTDTTVSLYKKTNIHKSRFLIRFADQDQIVSDTFSVLWNRTGTGTGMYSGSETGFGSG